MRRGLLALPLALAACAAVRAAPQGEALAEPSVAYLELSSRKVVAQPPPGLHVRGSQDGDFFVPQGDVLGEGPLGEAGTPGWLELGPRQFQPDRVARPPFPPYLQGYLTPQGEFRPSSRTVVYR